MITPKPMEREPSELMQEIFNARVLTRNDVPDPLSTIPNAKEPIFKTQIAPIFYKDSFLKFQELINMPDIASQEFAKYFAAYLEVKSAQTATFLQGDFKPSLQNNYDHLFNTRNGMAILNTVKN